MEVFQVEEGKAESQLGAFGELFDAFDKHSLHLLQ